jgi:DNA integrity scanning protein DisA with diadenylate cyclase activity
MIQTFMEKISITELVDIFTVAFLLYLIFLGFKKTKSVFVLAGIIISGTIYLIANIFGLRLLATLVQGFFAIILLAIVNIFPRNIGLRINQKNEQKE